MIRVYCYERCATCRKALKWLDEQGIEHEVIDIREDLVLPGFKVKDWEEKLL